MLLFFFYGPVLSFLSMPRNFDSSEFFYSACPSWSVNLTDNSNSIYFCINMLYMHLNYMYHNSLTMTPSVVRCTIILSTTRKNENAANLKVDAY